MKALNIAKHVVIGIACLVLIGVMIVGNVLANTYYTLISSTLGQITYRTEQIGDDEEIDSEYYSSEFNLDSTLLREEQHDFSEQVQAEGSVLLKRGNLPMASSGNISIMGSGSGTNSTNGFLYGGSGSGSIASDEALNVKEIFEQAGYNVNPDMWNYYDSGRGASGSRDIATGSLAEQPLSTMLSDVSDTITNYRDAAIIVIGRPGGEGNDLPFSMSSSDASDDGKHFLNMSQNEIDLVEWANSEFDQVVVLLNTMQVLEIQPIMELDNVSILWIGAAGEGGAVAIPSVLNGEITPSGRTVDTWMQNMLENDPAVINQGSFYWRESETSTTSNAYYVYAEGIYVGYRYYETRYADVVAGASGAGNYDYASVVNFPFGYGESYTTFEYSDYSVEETSDTVTVSVTVTNTGGTYSGKEVVQVYMRSPYTDFDRENGIEKEAVALVGFYKTDELDPGESEDVEIEISKEKMKVYDSEVYRTYIVEAGEYDFAIGTDAHDALNNILASDDYTVDDGMTAAGDESLVGTIVQSQTDTQTYSVGEDGEEITNRLTDVDIRTYDSDFEYLSRSNWEETFPEPYGGGSFIAPASMVEASQVPEPESSFEVDEMPTMGADNGLTLASMIGLDYDHPSWDLLLDQLTFDDMSSLIVANFGNAQVDSIQKPYMVDSDGPAGITSSLGAGARGYGYTVEVLLASTWNADLALRQGELIGEDSLATLTPGWYAPGVNIHRTPFSGRNFEYYSEDSLLSGEFAGKVIAGAMSKGVYCYMKHFALNDQETNRVLASTFCNEQAARQIYLNPFEIAIREYDANAMMIAMNRVGVVYVGHHKNLLDGIVRGEWGFNGIINTDTQGLFGTDINDTAIAAGLDCFLSVQSINQSDFEDPNMMMELREAAHHILYVTANSNGMNGFTPNTRIVDIVPPWMVLLIIANIVVIGGSVAGFVFNTIYTAKKVKRQEVKTNE